MEIVKYIDRDKCISCGKSELVQIHKETNHPHPTLDRYLKENPVLVRCKHCELAFVKKIPATNDFYGELYSDSNRDVSFDFLYSGKKLIFKQIENILLKNLKTGMSVLDIGAGTGAFINSIKNYFSVSGVELSPACSRYAREQGLDILTGSLPELVKLGKKYDAITLIDVLEHLTDPAETLKTCNHLLNSNGIIFIKVPNYKFQLIKQKILLKLKLSNEGIMQNFVHINHFHEHSLKFLLEKNGFKVLESGKTPPEIWDLSWKHAPKSKLYRLIYNIVVLAVTGLFRFNFYMVGKKV